LSRQKTIMSKQGGKSEETPISSLFLCLWHCLVTFYISLRSYYYEEMRTSSVKGRLGMDGREEQKSPLEVAASLGLDTSEYVLRDGEWYCYIHDARLVVQAVNPDVVIDRRYLRNPVEYGRVRRLEIQPSLFLHHLEDLLQVRYKNNGGHCGKCGKVLAVNQRWYCSKACKQAAYRDRRDGVEGEASPLSEESRRRISEGQKRRWAREKGSKEAAM
jgi:hypothetical protein